MRRRRAVKLAGNGQRASRRRRLRLRYAGVWLASRAASDTASTEPKGVTVPDPVSREALSPGVQRALAGIFPPNSNTTDGEQRRSEAAEVPLRRVAEEPSRYNTAHGGEVTPDKSDDV